MDLTIHLPHLQTAYHQDRYVHLPQFISAGQAAEYFEQTQDLPCKRVTCGIESVSWDEQWIPPDNDLFQFFASSKMVALIRTLLLTEDACHPQINCWISMYKGGEYINSHRDNAGNIQVILCLLATDQKNGGLLALKPREEDVFFALKPGDAIVFEATTIEHFTTPLIPSKDCPYPMRAVAVSRYSFVPPVRNSKLIRS
jgi:hypothetical protein